MGYLTRSEHRSLPTTAERAVLVYMTGDRPPISGHRLARLPFPIAYPARLATIARDPADRVDKTSHFVELTATTLGVLVLAWYSGNAEDAQPRGRTG
jgi:hypothetical protein